MQPGSLCITLKKHILYIDFNIVNGINIDCLISYILCWLACTRELSACARIRESVNPVVHIKLVSMVFFNVRIGFLYVVLIHLILYVWISSLWTWTSELKRTVTFKNQLIVTIIEYDLFCSLILDQYNDAFNIFIPNPTPLFPKVLFS